jgi:1-acyl-sn-glycerol-3-phosphate acyltransferase
MQKTMVLLRAVVFTLWMMVVVVPVGVVLLTASIFINGEPLYRICTWFLKAAIWGARAICGIEYRVHGRERLIEMNARGQRAVLCSKHQSTWETFAYPVLLPMPLSYVFKRELILVPFFGWSMARLDMIHIDRSKGADSWARIAKQGAEFMAKGCWVIMFPEGTRIARGRQGKYKNGAARLAIATNAPVVPIAVSSARVWPRGGFFRQRPGVVDVSFGPPIDPQGHTPDSLMAAVEQWIESEMRKLDPEAYAGELQAEPVRVRKASVGT